MKFSFPSRSSDLKVPNNMKLKGHITISVNVHKYVLF